MVANAGCLEGAMVGVCRAAVLGMLGCGLGWAQVQVQGQAQGSGASAAHHEANFDTERAKANDLYVNKRELEALPLYADLCRQDPTVAVFAERHAAGLFAKGATESDAAAAQRDRDEGMAELRRAKSLGDNSDYVENLLSAFGDKPVARPATGTAAAAVSVGYRDTENAEAKGWMQKAEAAFARNDTATALEDYKKASAADPGYYGAKLYAGDACFRAGDYACAGQWFEKAIAVDPNRETAYRYWGDAMYKGGHSAAAKTLYEQGVVAEPYTRFSWSGLTQWGTVTKTAMSSPPIQRPGIDDKGSEAKITMPNGPAGDIRVWTAYAGCRVDADKARAAGMRRTAAEEVHCLEVGLDAAAALNKGPDGGYGPGVKTLIALRKDGMLECWLLLNGADQEVLRDYPAYRDGHRELLRGYVDKYVVHEGEK